MPPPPSVAQYDSPELAITAINDLTRKHGYAVSISRTTRADNIAERGRVRGRRRG